ncbi:MAG: hypothetical protein ABXS91_05125 [Sulfurimonas sp.]
MNLNMNKTLNLIITVGTISLITGCGNGESSIITSNETNSLSQVKIDSTNQDKVSAALFDSVDITTPQLPTITTDASSASTKLSTMMTTLTAQSSVKTVSTVEPYSCSDGGSINSSYADGISTITYDQCQEKGTTINGQVEMSYNDSTGVISYMMSEYSISSDGTEYTTPATTYTISSDTISYTATGEATIDGQSIAFDHYSYSLTLVENKVNVSIDGSIKTACLGNWVTVKTNEAMHFTESDCPTAGDFEVQGEGSKLRVKFAADKSVDVYLNDALVQEYSDCNELPDSTSVCGV